MSHALLLLVLLAQAPSEEVPPADGDAAQAGSAADVNEGEVRRSIGRQAPEHIAAQEHPVFRVVLLGIGGLNAAFGLLLVVPSVLIGAIALGATVLGVGTLLAVGGNISRLPPAARGVVSAGLVGGPIAVALAAGIAFVGFASFVAAGAFFVSSYFTENV